MHHRARRLTVLLAVGIAAGGLAAAQAAPGTAAKRAVRLRHYTIYTYDMKVAVKGGASASSNDLPSENGSAVQDSGSGSFSIDGTIRSLVFYTGKVPRGLHNSGGSQGHRAVVNGTWSDQGKKCAAESGCEDASAPTTPFTCTGMIGTDVAGTMGASWKTSGGQLRFTLHTLYQELHGRGDQSCPPGTFGAGWLAATDPAVYITKLSIPTNALGQKTITRQISGPLSQNRIYFLQNCPSHGTCSLAWHGTARFKRTHVIKAVAPA